MPTITLPDGSTRTFSHSLSVHDIAADIGAGLAKAALAGKMNGKLVDTAFVIEHDAELAIITAQDPEGLDVIRHSTAHLLAQATKSLFPSAQVTIGPVIANGFYYDFAFERPFTPEDLAAIEQKMEALAKQDLPVTRQTMTRDAAIAFFQNLGESYKAKIIADIPADETLSLYMQGDFIDLCRGPHVPSTGKLKAFKLLKVAGAYWRGDAKNEMLQRIYGTAWGDKKSLEAYLHRIEEAEKRDHRKLAKTLDLFHIQEEAQGMVFWHGNGWAIYQEMEQYIRRQLRLRHYQEIRTPQIIDRSLWEKSGHWEKFSQEMFTTHSESRDYAIKPMSCPAHIQTFNQGLKSYRDLPMRLAEFGCCHRNEFSGALHGLMRVRSMVQDDGHIFCTEAQIQSEVSELIDFIYQVYADFGFSDILIKLSTRPEERLGDDALWDRAENALANALNSRGLTWELQPGEGAFYGPKIEFSLRDCLDRIWQCGTIQVDYFMPNRLGAHYIAEDGSRQVPVMLHRAILGTFERFMGILLEHYAGILPTWLSPTQVVVMNITDKQAAFAQKTVEILKNHGFRAKTDLRNEKIGLKIREHTLQRVPFQLVIGDRELETNSVSVRMQNGQTLGALSLNDFIAHLSTHLAQRSRIALEE